MTPLANTLLTNLLVILLCMAVLWIVGTLRRDVSLVDLFWGTGFAVVAWVSWRLNAPTGLRVLLLAGLTTMWGLRLSLFLLWRNWGQGEDRRYAAMRASHGKRFRWVSFLTVFLLQGVILWFVSWPLQVAAVEGLSAGFGWCDVIGVVLWGLGILFEAIGDWQLARFRADARNVGKVLDRGLWRFTRHPNYFGDFCIWWGLYLIAVAGGAGWTIGSPLLMTVLLLKVSGVTLLEKTITDRRPDYAIYQARTSKFFPWPPREPATRGTAETGTRRPCDPTAI